MQQRGIATFRGSAFLLMATTEGRKECDPGDAERERGTCSCSRNGRVRHTQQGSHFAALIPNGALLSASCPFALWFYEKSSTRIPITSSQLEAGSHRHHCRFVFLLLDLSAQNRFGIGCVRNSVLFSTVSCAVVVSCDHTRLCVE